MAPEEDDGSTLGSRSFEDDENFVTQDDHVDAAKDGKAVNLFYFIQFFSPNTAIHPNQYLTIRSPRPNQYRESPQQLQNYRI